MILHKHKHKHNTTQHKTKYSFGVPRFPFRVAKKLAEVHSFYESFDSKGDICIRSVVCKRLQETK